MKTYFLIFWIYAIIVFVQGSDPCVCDVPSMFLDEINCKPVYENPGDCCPIKYDCNDFDSRPQEKCHLLGQFYSKGEDIPDDIVSPFCEVNCRCTKSNGSYPLGEYTCAILDCPEWLGAPLGLGCYSKYEADKCCSVGEICPPFDKEATCEVDGNTYREGEKFEPKSDPSVQCACQKGFKGKFEAPFCIKTKCLTEIRNSENIQKYCAPVYFKTISDDKPICPYEFICSVPENKIERSGAKSESTDKCKLGESQSLYKGDKFDTTKIIFEYEKHNTACECKIPPFATCIKTIEYDFEKMPAHIKQYLQN